MKTAPVPTLADLRRYAIARSLFAPTTLLRAIDRLGFVQADPIRAPARAQDLTLRHRVKDYRAGDLEQRYPKLGLEEDFFVNYGFLRTEHHVLMHPRTARTVWDAAKRRQAQAVLEFVRERGAVHPREVDAHFAHGKTTNWFGGSSNATTQLLDGMHYRGMLRVARRDSGVRVYAARDAWTERPGPAEARARMDALVDLAVRKYAPLPSATLGMLLSYACVAAPQWRADRAGALARARSRLAGARIDGVDWYWPAGENPLSARHANADDPSRVRLLAPFDPLVWDRRRFEAFWGWAYRFEAYTPAPRRKLGYYALPLLWGDQVVGWANLRVQDGRLLPQPGYVAARPRAKGFAAALDDELQRMSDFLGL
jgi:uncharacterized protein YcaQ